MEYGRLCYPHVNVRWFFFLSHDWECQRVSMDLIYIISFGNFLRSCKSVCFLQNENESVNDNLYVWLFLLSGNPLVFVHYSAIWSLTEVLPSNCPNISTRLIKLKDILEKTLAENCQELDVNATVQFTYSFLSFQVCIYVYINTLLQLLQYFIVGQYYRHGCYLIISILLRLSLQSPAMSFLIFN